MTQCWWVSFITIYLGIGSMPVWYQTFQLHVCLCVVKFTLSIEYHEIYVSSIGLIADELEK